MIVEWLIDTCLWSLTSSVLFSCNDLKLSEFIEDRFDLELLSPYSFYSSISLFSSYLFSSSSLFRLIFSVKTVFAIEIKSLSTLHFSSSFSYNDSCYSHIYYYIDSSLSNFYGVSNSYYKSSSSFYWSDSKDCSCYIS